MGANANRSGQKGGGPEKRPLQPLRVLIVDDSEDDCLLVVQQLRCSGFKPDYRRVFTAEAMRNALASEPWEAIICDYAMPSFSALTALELFQKQQIDIPFIVVSGTVGEAEAVDTMKHGAHDYVMKNRLERLGEAVRREIQQARMRAESKQLETQKEHLRRVLQAIRNVNQLIVREKNRESLVQRACDTLVETRGFDRAWIVLSAFPGAPIVSGQTRIPEEIFSRFVSLFRTGELPLCCRRSSMENPVLFTQKTRTVCTDCPLGGNHNGTSALTTRIVYEGKLYGFLGVSLQSGLTATEEEMSLFVEMAGDLGFTLHNQEQEASLRVSEERYRRLFETMSQGVVYQDAQGVITLANPAAERILGLSLEQMTGRTSLDPRGQPIHEDGSPFPAPTHPARVALSTGEAIEGVVIAGSRWTPRPCLPRRAKSLSRCTRSSPTSPTAGKPSSSCVKTCKPLARPASVWCSRPVGCKPSTPWPERSPAATTWTAYSRSCWAIWKTASRLPWPGFVYSVKRMIPVSQRH
jgi:PAS domain-containing protein